MTGKKPILALIFVIVLIGAAAAICNLAGSRAAKQDGPAAAPPAPAVATARVVSQLLSRQIRLPGELKAYQDVAIFPKVQGFIEWIGVDRGSVVKRGQLLVRMKAPEIVAQQSEAQAKSQAAASNRVEAEQRILATKAQRTEALAKLAADDATYQHLKSAAATPGVVAGNDVEVALRTVEADRARVTMYEQNEKALAAQAASLVQQEKAARDAAESVKEIESYLRIAAPFDGIITERNVHDGSLVGAPAGGNPQPMLRLQQVSSLRLVVYVPEDATAGINTSEKVDFSVSAYPAEKFTGTIQRIAHSLDEKTRTMPVELDVPNGPRRLSPGMYAEVSWPNKRASASLFVPPSAIATTTERTFVLRVKDGTVQWVDVKRGAAMGDLVEVFGDLAEGDAVALRGSDELRDGSRVVPKEQTTSH